MNRILVWGLSNRRAGTEGVISNICGLANEVSFDFLTLGEAPNFNHLITEHPENRFFPITPKSKSPLRYARELCRFAAEHSHEYSALWFNTNHSANIDLLKLAAKYKIPRRIVHSHNSKDPSELPLKILAHANFETCNALATEKWACSQLAGDYLFGETAYKIIPNFIDVASRTFSKEKRAKVRKELGLDNKLVIGTIGRLTDQKNQTFLVELMANIANALPGAELVIVGEGELEKELKERAVDSGVAEKVHLVGPQGDVQAYLSAFDAFALPSLFEGLPLVLLEAQFNGLPCVISTEITSKAIISKGVQQLPLSSPDKWLEAFVRCDRKQVSLIPERAKVFDLEANANFINNLFI